MERGPAQDQVLVGQRGVPSAQGVVGAEGDLHVAVGGAGVACALLGAALRHLHPARPRVRAPADVRDDERLGVSRLLQVLLEQDGVHAALHGRDGPVLHLDAHRLLHVAAQHHQQVPGVEHQRAVGAVLQRRAVEEARGPTVPASGHVADAVLGDPAPAVLAHGQVRSGLRGDAYLPGLFQLSRAVQGPLPHGLVRKAAPELVLGAAHLEHPGAARQHVRKSLAVEVEDAAGGEVHHQVSALQDLHHRRHVSVAPGGTGQQRDLDLERAGGHFLGRGQEGGGVVGIGAGVGEDHDGLPGRGLAQRQLAQHHAVEIARDGAGCGKSYRHWEARRTHRLLERLYPRAHGSVKEALIHCCRARWRPSTSLRYAQDERLSFTKPFKHPFALSVAPRQRREVEGRRNTKSAVTSDGSEPPR